MDKETVCHICSKDKMTKLLAKDPVEVWIGASDSVKAAGSLKKFSCDLFQCLCCGHVQQSVGDDLHVYLNKVYSSECYAVSTNLGQGNWGERRGSVIKVVLDSLLDKKIPQSAIEVGCANGYILSYLKSKGIADLVGIDPCLRQSETKDGITYIKDYVKSSIDLDRKFDLVISFCAFEHIKDVNDAMCFIAKHLSPLGRILLEVPNSMLQLRLGDPAVFLHEHIHHFTPKSLEVMFSKQGFQVDEIRELGDSLFVFGSREKSHQSARAKIEIYDSYSQRLNSVLERISQITSGKKVAFHGACNSLNNIITWASINRDFGLFDNDQTKLGKIYLGAKVDQPSRELIDQYQCIVIIPYAYYEDIAQQYRDIGFKGELVSLVTNE